MATIVTYQDLINSFQERGYKVIFAADAEPVVHKKEGQKIIQTSPPGGVSVALEPIARASNATYVARAKTPEDALVVDNQNKFLVQKDDGSFYHLKRLFVPEEEADPFYNGFSNQTMWPLCHIAFEKPEFKDDWFESYKKVNKRFAEGIKSEIKGKTFVWIHDYQLAMVPAYLDVLGKPKDTMVGLFWHIPWPTWEIFRILPQKKLILESLLKCDFIAFHRGYQTQNFIETVERELECRVDREKSQIHYNKHITTVKPLPLGIDTDIISSLYEPKEKESLIRTIVRQLLGPKMEQSGIESYFDQYKVILGIDRLDYTKGIPARLRAVDRFFELYPSYQGKAVYLSILAPSREKIPSYQHLKKEVMEQVEQINTKYQKGNWKPIQIVYAVFKRKDLVNFYSKADLCLITPLDDGMNLVSKEFVISSSFSDDPGMLVLSQFAGSAIDLTESLIVNPYDTESVAKAIKIGLEMPKKEKLARTQSMVETLKERNIYEWAQDFLKATETAYKDNQMNGKK